MALIGLRWKKRANAFCEDCAWHIDDGDPGPVKTKARTHATQNEHEVKGQVTEPFSYVKRG